MITENNTLQAWLRLQFLICKDGRKWALAGLALTYERVVLFKLSRLSLLLAHCRVSASFSTSFFEYEWAPPVRILLFLSFAVETDFENPYPSIRTRSLAGITRSYRMLQMYFAVSFWARTDYDAVPIKHFISLLAEPQQWLTLQFAVRLILLC